MFYDVLGIIASAMITQDGSTSSRVLRFDEFAAMVVGKEGLLRIDPIPRLVADFSVEAKPILWLRFMALAQLCIGLLETQGSELGLEREEINIDQALDATDDVHLREHRQRYREALSGFRTSLAPTPGSGQ